MRDPQPSPSREPERPSPVRPPAQALPSLLQEFQGIPDHRRAQGRKFQLPTLLALWALARLSGYRGVDATWRFAGALNQEELRSLGAWRNPRTGRYDPPSRATLHRAMIDTDPKRFQSALQRWVARRQPAPTALAADGKRLRGANRQGDAHYETVSLVRHDNAMPIASHPYTEEGGEIAAVRALLEEVDVRGAVITLDALHTTRNTLLALRRRHGAHYQPVAKVVTAFDRPCIPADYVATRSHTPGMLPHRALSGGRRNGLGARGTFTTDCYLLTVKGNSPETYETLETIHWDRDTTSRFSEDTQPAHGRIEDRRIQVLNPLPGLINYPQVRQIFRITRTRTLVKTDETSAEVTYGMTSLPPDRAEAERLLALNRGHWTIENRNHLHRDTTFGEDACLMHTGHGPSNNAIVNLTALAIIFHRGFPHVQAAVQHFAMDRRQAFRAVTGPG